MSCNHKQLRALYPSHTWHFIRCGECEAAIDDAEPETPLDDLQRLGQEWEAAADRTKAETGWRTGKDTDTHAELVGDVDYSGLDVVIGPDGEPEIIDAHPAIPGLEHDPADWSKDVLVKAWQEAQG